MSVYSTITSRVMLPIFELQLWFLNWRVSVTRANYKIFKVTSPTSQIKEQGEPNPAETMNWHSHTPSPKIVPITSQLFPYLKSVKHLQLQNQDTFKSSLNFEEGVIMIERLYKNRIQQAKRGILRRLYHQHIQNTSLL